MENFDFKQLNSKEQEEYIKVAYQMFGITSTFSEAGEPIYFDDKCRLNPIHQFVLDRIEINKNIN